MPSASPSIFSEFRINFQQNIAGVGRATLLLLEAFSALISPPFRFKLFFKQMEFIGNKSLWITILTGTFTGMVLTIQSYIALKTITSESIVRRMVAVSMTRQLG
ncbi:MAG: MlaE family ABC transporter permease, partial [bacterium]